MIEFKYKKNHFAVCKLENKVPNNIVKLLKIWIGQQNQRMEITCKDHMYY